MICFLNIIFFVIFVILIWIVLLLIVFRKEIDAVFERDPAAQNSLEVVLLYSGLQ